MRKIMPIALLFVLLTSQVFADVPAGWSALPPGWRYDATTNVITDEYDHNYEYSSATRSYVYVDTEAERGSTHYVYGGSGFVRLGTAYSDNPTAIYVIDRYEGGEWTSGTMLPTPIPAANFAPPAPASSGSPAPTPATRPQTPSPSGTPAPQPGPGSGGSGTPLPTNAPAGWTQPNLGTLTADGKTYEFDRELNMYINEADETFISISPDGTILRGSVKDLNVNNPIQNLQIYRDGEWRDAESGASAGVTLQILATRDDALNQQLFPVGAPPPPEPRPEPTSLNVPLTTQYLDRYSTLSAGAATELTQQEREALASASGGSGFVVYGEGGTLEFRPTEDEGMTGFIGADGRLHYKDAEGFESVEERALPPSFATALAQGGSSVRKGTDDEGRTYFYTPLAAQKDEGLIFDFIPAGGDVRVDNGDGTYTTIRDRTMNRCGIGCTGRPGELVEVSRDQSSMTTSMFTVGEGDEQRQVELTTEETKGIFNIELDPNQKTAVDLGRNTITYDRADPLKPQASMTYTSPPRRDREGNVVEPGRVLFTRNADDEYVDQEGNVVSREYALERLEAAGLDVIERRMVIRNQDREVLNNPGYSLDEKIEVMGVLGSAGFLMKAYNQYSGLTSLSNLIWDSNAKEVEERRQRMIQEFCLAGGIENCLVSAICGQVHEITPSNVIAGRGPGGQFISSGVINAERSFPIDIRGLSRQQLIDILGRNITTIQGIRVDLSNPSLNLSRFGNITLRLYHIQVSVTNNVAGEKDLRYNVELRRTGAQEAIRIEVPATGTTPATIEEGQVEFPTAYGEPISQAKIFKKDRVLKPTETTPPDERHEYFNSFAEWDTACLLVQPGLPKGTALDSSFGREFCTPIKEYRGGPTTISPQEAQTQAPANVTSREADSAI